MPTTKHRTLVYLTKRQQAFIDNLSEDLDMYGTAVIRILINYGIEAYAQQHNIKFSSIWDEEEKENEEKRD